MEVYLATCSVLFKFVTYDLD
uniref:Uncharacterized protein n=1 Tax=Arundo donax TaxID=35708 RepID=A0A0A8ZYB3_ARUDO